MQLKDTIEKRFIAGAKCPKCGSLDALLFYYNEDNVATRECVDCDYTEVFKETEEQPKAVDNNNIQRISIKEL